MTIDLVRSLLLLTAVLLATACGGSNGSIKQQAEALPVKGYSIEYEAVGDTLDQLGNADLVCAELQAAPGASRSELLRMTHPDLVSAGRTDPQWAELELAYLANCYDRGLWPYGTVINMDTNALDAMVMADPDTPAYCAALSPLSDEDSRELLLATHTAPLYASLSELEADRTAMHVAYIAVCQELGLWQN